MRDEEFRMKRDVIWGDARVKTWLEHELNHKP